tara:strand:+ start:355 stop:690 length:336 start_codon:yes stop_codon:yes gene_type:complete
MIRMTDNNGWGGMDCQPPFTEQDILMEQEEAQDAASSLQFHREQMATRYIVNNDTDKIPASESPFDTREEAEDFIKKFRKRFLETQGYYKTSSFERIHPNEIQLSIEEVSS